MTTQPTPNTELMQQNRSLPYYDGGELRSKAPRRPQSTTGGPPRAWFRSGIAVLVSVLFVGLAGINLLAQLRYSVTGRQAVGTVVEFHFSAGRRGPRLEPERILDFPPEDRSVVEGDVDLGGYATAAPRAEVELDHRADRPPPGHRVAELGQQVDPGESHEQDGHEHGDAGPKPRPRGSPGRRPWS